MRAYILAYSSGATGIFFLALAGKDSVQLTGVHKVLLLSALFFYVTTVVMCLFELQVDARRFFYIATQLERPENEQNWYANDVYRRKRLWLIYGSYFTAIVATLLVLVFLVMRII